jgi:acyl carrier protein
MDVLEDIVYPVVEDMQESIEHPELLAKSPDTRLIGQDAACDSVALVSFIVALENRIEDKLDVSLTIANEKAMSRKSSPFLTLGTLAEYIKELLKEAGDG